MFHGTTVRDHGCRTYRGINLHVHRYILVFSCWGWSLCHVIFVHGCRVLGYLEMGRCCIPTLRQPLVDLYCLHGRTIHRCSLVELAGNPCHCIHILFQKIRNHQVGYYQICSPFYRHTRRDHVGYYPGRDYRCRLVWIAVREWLWNAFQYGCCHLCVTLNRRTDFRNPVHVKTQPHGCEHDLNLFRGHAYRVLLLCHGSYPLRKQSPDRRKQPGQRVLVAFLYQSWSIRSRAIGLRSLLQCPGYWRRRCWTYLLPKRKNG